MGPLDGLRVVDCSTRPAGLRAAGYLADYGADVVWVEPPGGDLHRARRAVEYSVYNRGKRSIELDLDTLDGRAALRELVNAADVLVETWAPGVGAHLGLDDASLRSDAPHLVHCSITGFGLDGSARDLPVEEAIVHAFIGIMSEQVGHRPPPIYEGLPFATIGAASLGVIATLAALYRRHDDGRGRHVETSLLDGALAYLSMMWGDTNAGLPPVTAGQGRLVARTFLCADGEYLGVHTGAVGAFGRLMKVLGIDDRIPASESGMDIGVPLDAAQAVIVNEELPVIFATRPRAEWLEALLAADVCAVPELRPGEIFDQPQVLHNGMAVEVDDPVLGRVTQVAPAAKFSRTPADVPRPAPVAGNASLPVFLPRAADPRADAPDARALLDGVRVLDLGAYYAGPCASRLLADLGADVIKLEPTAGDQLRGLSRPFRSAQAGKRSLAVNLKDPELDDARAALLAWADVVHHNLRPGAAERLGVAYADARSVNAEVVYAYAPGWGSSGPDMHRQSFAPLVSGFVGVGFEVGGEYNPPMFPLGNEDPGNGMLGAAAILMALLHRRRTGDGQYVEHVQLNATMTHVQHIVRTADGQVLGAGRVDLLQRGVDPLDRLYETADGWLVVVAAADDAAARLAAALDVPFTDDDRFATWRARRDHAYELSAMLDTVFAAKPTAEWLAMLAGAGVPAAEPRPTQTSTFLGDPEHLRSGRAAQLTSADGSWVREVGTLFRVSDTELPPHRAAPALGEHTEAILTQVGYSHERIDVLRTRGAVRTPS